MSEHTVLGLVLVTLGAALALWPFVTRRRVLRGEPAVPTAAGDLPGSRGPLAENGEDQRSEASGESVNTEPATLHVPDDSLDSAGSVSETPPELPAIRDNTGEHRNYPAQPTAGVAGAGLGPSLVMGSTEEHQLGVSSDTSPQPPLEPLPPYLPPIPDGPEMGQPRANEEAFEAGPENAKEAEGSGRSHKTGPEDIEKAEENKSLQGDEGDRQVSEAQRDSESANGSTSETAPDLQDTAQRGPTEHEDKVRDDNGELQAFSSSMESGSVEARSDSPELSRPLPPTAQQDTMAPPVQESPNLEQTVGAEYETGHAGESEVIGAGPQPAPGAETPPETGSVATPPTAKAPAVTQTSGLSGAVQDIGQARLDFTEPDRPGTISGIPGHADVPSMEESPPGRGSKPRRDRSHTEAARGQAPRRISPVLRGGAPRGKRRESPRPRVTDDGRPSSAAPEVVCWQRPGSWSWSIGVKTDEESLDRYDVVSGDTALSADSEGRYEVGSLARPLHVLDEKGDYFPISLRTGDEPILFKLSGGIEARTGHLVDHCVSGAYLALVPEEWERGDDETWVAPSGVDVEERLKAYLFTVDSGHDGGIRFTIPGGYSRAIEPRGTGFSLDGVTIPDASRGSGPLFADGPPRLILRPDLVADRRYTVVVGREGSGRGRWRGAFYFTGIGDPLNLDQVLVAHGAGWFFARIYDPEGNLVESLDFRYVRGLTDIHVDSARIPDEFGHRPAALLFRHAPGISVTPNLGTPETVPLKTGVATETGTVFELPAAPEYDSTGWLIRHQDGSQVTARLSLSRVWWALSEGMSEPEKWTDKPIPVSTDDLTSSRRGLWVLLPTDVEDRHPKVGFSLRAARQYNLTRRDRSRGEDGPFRLQIKLREYADSPELWSGKGFKFRLWQSGLAEGFTLIRNRKLLCLQSGCSFSCDSVEEMVEHLHRAHTGDFSRKVKYEEIAEHEEGLPAQIYVCHYCGHIIKVDRRGATSEMLRHQEKECKTRKPHDHIELTATSDPERIRRLVFPNLPNYVGCRFCLEIFRSNDSTTVLKHAIKKHAADLWGVEP